MIGPSANDKIAPSYRSLYAILRHDTQGKHPGFFVANVSRRNVKLQLVRPDSVCVKMYNPPALRPE